MTADELGCGVRKQFLQNVKNVSDQLQQSIKHYFSPLPSHRRKFQAQPKMLNLVYLYTAMFYGAANFQKPANIQVSSCFQNKLARFIRTENTALNVFN